MSRSPRRAKSCWPGCCAEAGAAQPARFHEPHEEGVELVVLVIARLPEPRHGVGSEAAEHLEPPPEDGDPFDREVFGSDGDESGAREQRLITFDALERDRGHPLVEPSPLAVAQARGGYPVAERDTPAREEDAPTLGQGLGLVRDMEQALLAHHGGEGTRPEGQYLRIAAHHAHEAVALHRSRAERAARPP